MTFDAKIYLEKRTAESPLLRLLFRYLLIYFEKRTAVSCNYNFLVFSICGAAKTASGNQLGSRTWSASAPCFATWQILRRDE